MLIKVKDKDGWFIYGDVKQITYKEKAKTFTDLTEVRKFINERPYDGVHLTCLDGSDGNKIEYSIKIINFKTDDGKQNTVLFDGKAFLCNDQGDTIERL